MRGRRAEIKPSAGAIEKAPPPPSALPKAAHTEWKRVTADLVERGLMVEAMTGPVSTFCIAILQRDACVKALARDGWFVKTKTGEPKPHPAQGLLNKSQELITRLGAELGLTAASRSRKALRPDTGKSSEQDDDWSEVDL